MVWGRRFGLAVLLGSVLTVLPREAYGHSMAYYASTPLSPPQGFLWVAFVFWALTLTVGAVLLKTLGRRGWVSALAISLTTTFLFSALFIGVGAMAANANTGPPPGLGWGYPVHWGLTRDSYTRSIFLSWNTGGLVLLAAVAFFSSLFFARRGMRGCLAVVGADTAVYLLCLTPYISTGAWTHGWAGGYVHRACEHQVAELGCAVLLYAEAHDGRLPSAEGIEDLYRQVEPYLRASYDYHDKPAYACPVGSAFQRTPVLYLWNRQLSGSALSSLKEPSPPLPLLACPYAEGLHRDWPVVLFTWDLFHPETAYDGRQYLRLSYAETLPPGEIWTAIRGMRTPIPDALQPDR